MTVGMSVWRKWLVSSYYYVTLPWRRQMLDRAARQGTAPLAVLFYHRVADYDPNPWTITNRAFRQQVQWLGQQFDLVSLEEVQERLGSGNRRPAVAITFDDGYAENCEQALPYLIQHRIPVTYFVATQPVLDGAPFPHDRQHTRPARPNSLRQLRALARAGVAIGAHTRTHADLGPVADADVLFDEVVRARDELQEAVGCPVRYFAFPYGRAENLNDRVFALAKAHGFACVCSTLGGYHFPGDDPFHLRRIHGDPHLVRLKNWLHGDPRLYLSSWSATRRSGTPRPAAESADRAARRMAQS